MIEITKTYRTRCGYPVRIYATDGVGAYPIHGAYCEGGAWVQLQWTDAGSRKIGSTCPRDLVEVKPRIQREVWVNVYPETIRYEMPCYSHREDADRLAESNRLACVKITIDCEHGEGLEDANA